jgi:hypothetical protein
VLSAIAVELERDRAEQRHNAADQVGASGWAVTGDLAADDPVTGQVAASGREPGAVQVPGAAPAGIAALADGGALGYGAGPPDGETVADGTALAVQADTAALANGVTLAYGVAPADGAATDGAPAVDEAAAADGAVLADWTAPASETAPADWAAPASETAPAGETTSAPSLADGVTFAYGVSLADGASSADDPATTGEAPPPGPPAPVDGAPGGAGAEPGSVPGGETAGETTEPETKAPWPAVPLPRRAPGENGAAPPPAQVRREYLPPSLLGLRPDPEAHTEPIPKIPGIRPDDLRSRHGDNPAAAGAAPSASPSAGPPWAAAPPATDAPAAPWDALPDALPSGAGPAMPVPGPPAAAPTAPGPAPDVSTPPAPQAGSVPPAPPARPANGAETARPAARPAAQAPTRPQRPGHWRLAGLILAVLALVVAGAIMLLQSGHDARGGHSTGSGSAGGGAGAAVRDRAAAWVAGQVSRTAVVACDPVMCQALRAQGVPAPSLYQLGAQTTSPLRSQVIVATAVVRARFGGLLGSVYAPAVLASFGAGPDRIDVRQTAQHGAGAYRAMARADLASRRASGIELLRSSRIAVTFTARRQLASGDVDPRLLIAIAQMAATHPMYIVDFGLPAPGAGPDVPLRRADLAEAAHARHHPGRVASPRYVRSMVTFLHAQHGEFRPAYIRTVRLPGGAAVLRIEFTAPSPLGLLGPRA